MNENNQGIKSEKQACSASAEAPLLYAIRDELIRQMWATLNKISHTVGVDDFTDEDLKIWTAVTEHSAIQKRLGGDV